MQSHLVYHYTSLKHKKLWKPFKTQLYSYLKNLKGQRLLILGGSSAACLNTEFLKNFKEIVIYDTDFLAPVFFKLHHGFKIKPRYLIKDAFSSDGENLTHKTTQDILTQHQPDVVLLSNVVGQLPLYYKNFFKTQDYKDWSERLVETLQNYCAVKPKERTWVSFHDLISFESPLNPALFEKEQVLQDKKDLQDLVRVHPSIESFTDHLTFQQAWPCPSPVLTWYLNPQTFHFVQLTGSPHFLKTSSSSHLAQQSTSQVAPTKDFNL